MSAVTEPDDRGRSPELVRREVEAVLLRVMTAGRVAEVLWRLLQTERRVHRWRPAGPGGARDGAVMTLAWHGARDAIAATEHERAPWVYHAAVRAACSHDGDRDLVALVLAEIAALHLRLGYAGDCRRLIELAAEDEELPGRVQRVLAAVRVWVADYERHGHDVESDHDEGSRDR